MKVYGSAFDEPTAAEALAQKKPSRIFEGFRRVKTAVMCPFNKFLNEE